VWAFDAAAALRTDAVTKAAAALGISGAPVAQWGSWVVGPTDGSGPSLTVSGDGQASASYNDPSLFCGMVSPGDPGRPTTPAPGDVVPKPTPLANQPVAPQPFVTSQAASPDGSASSGTAGSAGPPESTSSAGCASPALGADAAAAKARDLLGGLGADLRAVRTSVSTDGATSNVEVDQQIAGQGTGVTWSVTFVGSRLQSLWGPLAHLVDLGVYPLISPAQAVDRLSDPRFGTSGSVPTPMAFSSSSGRTAAAARDSAAVPVPAAAQSSGGVPATASDGTVTASVVAPADGDTSDPAASAAPSASPAPGPGARLAWQVTQVTLVKAELVLAPTSLTDGSAVLLPTYRLTDTDGGTWDVPAVVDAALAFGG
jgi:hypothetical protein